MAFSGSQNTVLYDCSFTDIQGDSNTYHINGSEPGLADLLKVICPGAAYDAAERDPPPRCYPGTRTQILADILRWVDTGPAKACSQVLWLHGPAGAGKSAIAQTICEGCAERGDLAASFFFSRGRPGRDTHTNLFTTIAFQLAMSIPRHRTRVRNAIDKDPLAIHKSARIQIQKLIVDTFQSRSSESHDVDTSLRKSPSLIVIDGLDECNKNDVQTQILMQILDLVRTPSVPLRFMIVSRPEPHIQHAFTQGDLQHFTSSMSLFGDRQSHEDVRTYFISEFDRIYSSERHSATFSRIPRPFPRPDDLNLLVRRSDGYFIYAATVVRYVDEEYFSPLERLEAALNASSSSESPFEELDRLYHQVLSTCRNPDLLKKVLGLILAPNASTAPARSWFITEALRIRPDQLLITLRGLQSILRHNPDEDVFYPCHASLRDFIFDPCRAGKFHMNPQMNQAMTAGACWEYLKTRYRSTGPENLYNTILVLHNLFSQLHDAGEACRDIVHELLLTNTQFWYFHFRAMCDSFDDETVVDLALMDWLRQAIQAFETVNPPFVALSQHFSALHRIALGYCLSWLSALENGLVENESFLAEKVLAFFGQEYNFGVQFPRLSLRGGFQDHQDPILNLPVLLRDLEHVRVNHCDVQAAHTHLAMQCMHILTSSRSPCDLEKLFNPVSTALKNFGIKAYIYSRMFWGGHVSRAPPGDADILFQLRRIQDQFPDKDFVRLAQIQQSESFNEESIGKCSQHQILQDPGYWINHVLDMFASRGRHDEPIKFSFPVSYSSFRKCDLFNTELILQWLKSVPEPPMDLVYCWEMHCKEREEALSLEDGEVIRNNTDDMCDLPEPISAPEQLSAQTTKRLRSMSMEDEGRVMKKIREE